MEAAGLRMSGTGLVIGGGIGNELEMRKSGRALGGRKSRGGERR